MQKVVLKASDWDTLLAFVMEVGKVPQKVSKSFPELSWRALNKLDAVASDIESVSRPAKEAFGELNKKFGEQTADLKERLDAAEGEEKKVLINEFLEEQKKFREANDIEAKEKEELSFELADDKFEMVKKLLEDHSMEMFVRREPLDVLLPAFGLKE